MKAYKGFTKDIKSIMGDRVEENCSFELGVKKKVEGSKTAREGFHCCEYLPDCLRYYSMIGSNRFFVVEASGDIDEDDHRIACTEITLTEELSVIGMAHHTMIYLIQHQDRDDWERSYSKFHVKREEAEAPEGGVAIARGQNPKVRGKSGAVLGIIVEDEEGIKNAKMFVCSAEYQDKWMTLDGRELVAYEEKTD